MTIELSACVRCNEKERVIEQKLARINQLKAENDQMRRHLKYWMDKVDAASRGVVMMKGGGFQTTIDPPDAPRWRNEDHCKGCGRRILWGKTAQGKWAPVDPGLVTIYDGDGRVHRGYVPHHSTCERVEDFR